MDEEAKQSDIGKPVEPEEQLEGFKMNVRPGTGNPYPHVVISPLPPSSPYMNTTSPYKPNKADTDTPFNTENFLLSPDLKTPSLPPMPQTSSAASQSDFRRVTR